MGTIFRQHRNRPEHIHDNFLNKVIEIIDALGGGNTGPSGTTGPRRRIFKGGKSL